ncbi:hypothetical protein Tco_1344430 [Tanacetum coccineum]
MATPTDKAILSGADNRPPMLEKDMYDSWKSRMELYMMNRQHGRMILESVENVIQADYDIKATNSILQGLPPEVYALVSNHKIAKELWERMQLLMQETSLTKQEKECKLYDEFDKFAYKKGETLREFYLRFSLLLNDMNIYNMKLEQFQVNTKFLNTLPPEWSKFVTDVKLVRDLHTTNIDQLHAYLGQHEFHANEVRLMHERNSDPLALVATHQMTQSPYQTHQNSYQNTQFQPQVSPYQSPQYGSPYQSQQYSTHQSSTPLSITYPSNDYQSSIHHNKGDDPIDAINHMMSFLIAVVTSHYPTTNNQGDKPLKLRVIYGHTLQEQVEAIMGNKGRLFTTTAKGKAICPNSALNPRGNKMILKDQATQTVITHNDAYQANDLDVFVSDCDERNTAKVALMANLSHYGSDALAKAAVQNFNSSAQQDALILSVIEQLKTQVVNCTKINLENKSVNDTLTVELERYKEQVKVLKEGQNVDLKKHLKEKESLMQTVTLLKNDFKKEESRNIDREIALEKRIKQLDNIVFKRDQSAQTVHMLTKPQFFYDHTTKQALGFQNPFYLKKAQQLEPKLYVGDIIEKTNAIVIPDSEETLMLAEESRSKMLLKQKDPIMLEKKVNTTPVDYAVLNQLSQDFEKQFVPQTELSAEQAFWSQNFVNSAEPTLSSRPTNVEVPKELPKVSMVNTSLKKLKHHLAGLIRGSQRKETTPTTITDGLWGI